MNAKATGNVAWGLELGAGAARLVRVVRTDGACRVDLVQEALLANLHVPESEPLGVCFPDEATLYRGLGLPGADRAVMAKMVQAQCEALLPTRADRFAWGWDDMPDPLIEPGRWVLLCAGRRDALERVQKASAALGGQLVAVVPSAVAAASAYLHLHKPMDHALLVVTPGAATGLALVMGGGILRCGVLGQSDGADGAAGELREAYAALVEGLPLARRPKRCVLLGRQGTTEGLRELVQNTLGLEVRSAPPAGADGPSYAAVGAALHAFEDLRPAINLMDRPAAPSVRRPVSVRRWARPVGWLLAAVLMLYAADLYQAHRLGNQVQRIQADTATHGGIERQLAIARYLEKDGAPPLAILDAISKAAPPTIRVTTWSYTRAGEVRLAGSLLNPADFDPFLKKLAESRLLKNVELKTARIDEQNQQIQFELTAAIPPYALAAAATRPAATQPPKMDTMTPGAAPASSNPAPASRPGGAP